MCRCQYQFCWFSRPWQWNRQSWTELLSNNVTSVSLLLAWMEGYSQLLWTAEMRNTRYKYGVTLTKWPQESRRGQDLSLLVLNPKFWLLSSNILDRSPELLFLTRVSQKAWVESCWICQNINTMKMACFVRVWVFSLSLRANILHKWSFPPYFSESFFCSQAWK